MTVTAHEARAEPRALSSWPLGGAIWMVLVVFGVGYLLTEDFFPADNRLEYGLMSVVATIACALFIVVLRGRLADTLAYWVVFVIFVWGYFVEFYWLVLLDDKPSLGFVLEASLKPEPMLQAYRQSAIAFLLSAITLNVLRATQSPKAVPVPSESEAARTAACRAAIAIAAFIFVATTVLMVVFGFGSPTRELQLPFRIAGWVFQSRRTLLPALLLFIISCAYDAKLRKYNRWALAIFLVSALIDMILITTRASLVISAGLIFSLLAVQQRLSRQVWMIALGALLITGALFPFISRLRGNRIGGMETVDAMAAAEVDGRRTDDSNILSPFIRRFTGMNSLIPIVNMNAQIPTAQVIQGFYESNAGPTDFTTSEVFMYGPRSATAVGPSMLGWMFIAGGELGEYVGCIVLMILVNLLWRLSSRVPTRLSAVLMSLVAMYLLTRLSDGTLEDVIMPALTIGGSIAAIELLLRLLDHERTAEAGDKRLVVSAAPR